MKQTLKIAIPIAALVAVVFGVTFFAQYSPNTPDLGTPQSGPTGKQPLRFFSSTRRWDPSPHASLQDRFFPGFYEAQANAAGPQNGATFWFENHNDKAVTVWLQYVSCTSCSGGRVAAIPPTVSRQILEMTGASVLPGGLFSPFALGMAGPAANLADDRLEWQSHTFKDNPRAEYKVPPADNPTGWTPQWGILELRFVAGAGPKELKSVFDLQVDGTKQFDSASFLIVYLGVEPFDLSRSQIEVGDLAETAKPQTYEILVFSATRGPRGNGPGDLPSPAVSVQAPGGGDPGPFVAVSPPVRVPESELVALPDQINRKNIKVEAAYRMTVTVAPRVGDARIDLGPLERDIHVSTGDTRKTLRVRGAVRGDIWLDEVEKELSLPRYAAAGGTTREFNLKTARPDAELAVVPDPATPDFLQVKVERVLDKENRPTGSHKLKLRIPPGKSPGGSWHGLVALESKGPQPQRIRIPVKGSATQ